MRAEAPRIATANSCNGWFPRGWLRSSRPARLLFGPGVMFLVAAVCLWATGRWRPLARHLVDPLGLVAGLVIGAILYFLSLFLVQTRPPLWRSYSAPTRPRLGRMAAFGARAVYEEAFWRGTVQFLLGDPLVGVPTAAALFTLRHLHLEWANGRRIPLRHAAEFLLFSLVLGGAFALTDRLLVVVGIHWARNLLIEARCTLRSVPNRLAEIEL